MNPSRTSIRFSFAARRLLFILLATLGVVPLFADVVEPGEIERSFKVINVKDFPQYRFYFMYTDYYYDMGYQPGPEIQTWIEQDSVYYTSDRDAASAIYAASASGTDSVTFVSEETVGGGDFVANERINTVIDVIEIVSVENGVVKFKRVKVIDVYDNGTTSEHKPGKRKWDFLPVGGGFDTPGWLYWLMPAVSLLALVAFWIWRRRQSQPRRAHA